VTNPTCSALGLGAEVELNHLLRLAAADTGTSAAGCGSSNLTPSMLCAGLTAAFEGPRDYYTAFGRAECHWDDQPGPDERIFSC
jgi:hypothetical protein